MAKQNMISVPMTEELEKKIFDLSLELGIKKASLIRMIVMEYFRNKGE